VRVSHAVVAGVVVLAISCVIGSKVGNDLSTTPCVQVVNSNSEQAVQPTATETPVVSPVNHPWGHADWGFTYTAKPDKGLLVDVVTPATAAGEFGLVRGDLIVTVNGQPVSTAKQLGDLLDGLVPGVWIKATWKKGDNTCTGSAVFGAYDQVGGLATHGGAAVKKLALPLEPGVELRFYWREYWSNSVGFKVLNPAGRGLMSSSGEAEYRESFLATSSGVYHLVFDNTSSGSTPRVVDLYYQIRRYPP
jgi:hypothetical protein